MSGLPEQGDPGEDARKLRKAADVLRIWKGGLAGPIAVLEDVARQLEALDTDEKKTGSFRAGLYHVDGKGWQMEVTGEPTREQVAGPFALERPWRSDDHDAARAEALAELLAQGWDVAGDWRWHREVSRFEAVVTQRPCTPRSEAVPVRELKPGQVLAPGSLGGLLELTRRMDTSCGYVRWRYVHRDAEALGRRGTTSLREDSTARVLTAGADHAADE
jgi:hypothetical protein